MSESKQIAAGIAAYRDDRRVLLGLRSPFVSVPGVWSIPGGMAEKNENIISAAIREFVEETDYPFVMNDCFHVYTLQSKYLDYYTFLCKVEDFEAFPNYENTRFGWFDLVTELPDKLHHGFAQSITALKMHLPKI